MSELLPDRPDPLDTLVPALRRAGIREAQIKAYVVHWRTVFMRATKRPCPLCYTQGGWGDLRPAADRDDIFYECGVCNATFWTDGTVTSG
jgi:hypothetical protein